MSDYKWFSIDIHPDEGKPLACISIRSDESIKYTNFDEDSTGPYWYKPNEEVPELFKPYHRGYFNNEGQSVNFDYWMYWEDFWQMLEDLPRINKDDIRNESHTIREWQEILAENPELAEEFDRMTPPQPIRGSIAQEVDLEKAAEEYASDYPAYNDEQAIAKYAFKRGAEWQKSQMLKDAVEGFVNYYEDSGGKLMAEAQVGCPYHFGDRVKIIIVKEDEQRKNTKKEQI